MDQLLPLALPLIVGTLTFGALQGLKRASQVVDRQPALIKRAVALGIAFVVTIVAERLGVPSPCSLSAAEACLSQLTPSAVQALVGALVAMAMHSVAKPVAA